MGMNDKYNVRFRAFFRLTMLILPASILYVTTIIPSYFGRNCFILSLFLMLSLAFAYVIILYIVYSRLYDENGINCVKSQNRVIHWIYETRMAIKAGILLFIMGDAVKQLMLRRYSEIVIVIPIILAVTYMGSRGFKGVVRFAEAVYWFALAAVVIIGAASLSNMDMSQLAAYTDFFEEDGLNVTVNRVMARGGLLFLGYSVLEMLMPVYLKVKDRKRSMLVGTVGTGTIIGLLGSAIVTTTLGAGALMVHDKNLLYIVGAMELPYGVKIRPLMLVCYLLVVSGVMIIVPHVVCGLGTIDRSGVRTRAWVWKMIWVLAVLVVCICIQSLLTNGERVRLISAYMILVDVPLSMILPAVAIAGRRTLKKYMLLCVSLVVTGVLAGCVYEPVEDVDYLNVIVIDEPETGDDGQSAEQTGYHYSFVVTGLDEDEDIQTKENVYEVDAFTLEEACRSYNEAHSKVLDISHTEYIVLGDIDILDNVCQELESTFATSYVNVVIEKNILEKTGNNNTKEYLKSHYEGACLATLKR